ncbi:MAG: alkaline phosphatase family protein [Candidatus Enteromonas sp.]
MDASFLQFDFDNTIVSFSSSLLAHFGATPKHKTLPAIDRVLEGHRKVVVLLFDGLGQRMIERHLKEGSFLRSHLFHTMEAVFPPTTVASTNAFLSGLYPVENGWLAWDQWIDQYNCNVEGFTNRDHNSGKAILPHEDNILRRLAPYASIFEQIRNAGFQGDLFRVFPSWILPKMPSTLKEARRKIDAYLNDSNDIFGYVYWTEPDALMHEFGVDASKVHREILNIQRFVKGLVKAHPDTLFLTIADHGLVDIVFEDLCDHPDLYSLLYHPVSMEGRVSTFFVKEGAKENFESLFKRYYGDRYVLLSKEEAKKIHLFGLGDEHPLFDEALGDFISVSITPYSLFASKDYKEEEDGGFLKAAHAGYTKDEMEIGIGVFND